MCKYNGESVDHLFLNCLAAMDFLVYGFGFICSKLGYAKVVGLLACWQGWFGQHRNGHIWIIVPHGLMRCLWRERNSKCFEDNERSMSDLKLFFFRTLLDWLSTLQNQSLSSFLDSLNLCNLCTWFVDPWTLPMYEGVTFFISIKIITYKKKKKKK